jgi:predicted nuclease with TOPRIM domain
MPDIDLSFIASQLDRVLKEQTSLRSEVADFRADMEVMAAIVRRMDGTMQGLVGEVRSLTAQQDRQRQKLERLRERIDGLNDPTVPA